MFSLATTEPLRAVSASAQARLQEEVTRLYEDARQDVYGYCLTFGLSPGEAQEAAQEVFLRLYEVLRRGETIDNPRAWVFRVAHNLSLKLRARQAARPVEDFDWDSQPSPLAATPEQLAMERQRMSRVHDAIAALSEQQKRCLLLRMEGLRYPEIGEALGISASSVGEFLRRAVQRLRKASRD